MKVTRSACAVVDFKGLKIRDYTGDRASSSSLAVVEVPPGASHMKSRSHRSDKFYYVEEGDIEFTLNDTPTHLTRGDFLRVEKGEWFSYTNRAARPVVMILVHTPSYVMAEEEFVTTGEMECAMVSGAAV